MIIAISGQVASGKTTIAREVARRINHRFVSIGELFRKIAIERGISLMELHKIAESDPSIDRAVDSVCIEEARKGNVVIEGHLAAWILKDIANIRIYLKADLEIRARRLASRDNRVLEEAIEEIRMRERSNRERYMRIYGIDLGDLSIFHLVIDTTHIDMQTVVKIIGEYIEGFREGSSIANY